MASIVSPVQSESAELKGEGDVGSALLMSKKATMAKARPALGARIRPAPNTANGSATVTGTATTVNLFVEGMHSVEARTHVEQALLKKEGVISFFSDIADEKVC